MSNAAGAARNTTLPIEVTKGYLSAKLSAQTMTYIMMSVGLILLILFIAYMIYYGTKPSGKGTTGNPQEISAAINARHAVIENSVVLTGQNSLYSTLINKLEPAERYLVNLCPLTASLGGYLGTGPMGVFDVGYYVQHALRAGIRSFVLPISTYIDDNKVPPNWPLSGKPAIICRDINGKIISLNGISVKEFCSSLMTYMTENSTQANEPIILYIKKTEGFIPDPLKEEARYVQLLSDIARDLDVIPGDRRLTSLGSYGSAVGSVNESVILTQIPLDQLQNKFIIMTNFDTKLALKTAYKGITPTLDSYTNFTTKPVIAQNAGLDVSAGSNTRSLKLGDISGSQVNWSDQARTVWHMTTQDDPLVTPIASIVEAATSTGIQMVPVPFYTTNKTEDVKPIWDLWKGYAWRLKAPAARYLKPTPVVPQAPSAKLNARVDSSLQPGQLAVR